MQNYSINAHFSSTNIHDSVTKCHNIYTIVDIRNEFSCVQNAAGHAAKMQCHGRSFLQLARLQYIAPHRRSSSSEPAKSSSINAEEVEKFSRIAHHWWNESGEFAALHTLNELRVTMIKDGLVERDTARSSLPLKGLSQD